MDPVKKQPAAPEAAAPDEGFDFELTDIEEARRVLDAESVSQFDVAGIASTRQWKRVRRAALPTDRALTGRAIDWLMSLPAALRPEHLSREYPRVANALAEIWEAPDQCQSALDKLLVDGRKGRQGFPPLVHNELVALRNWTQVF